MHSCNIDSLENSFFDNSTAVLRFQGLCTALQSNRKGRIKSLGLQLMDTVLTLDIPKCLGHSLQQKLRIGSNVQAWVRPQHNGLKTLMIVPETDELPPVLTTWADAVPVLSRLSDRSGVANPTAQSTPLKLQVCTKGSCRKQGSLKLVNHLNQQVQAHGLETQVQIEAVGCLKRCKKAPNVSVSPSGQWVSPTDLQDLSHFLETCTSTPTVR